MAEESNSMASSSTGDTDHNLQINDSVRRSGSSDFCLLYEDDVESGDNGNSSADDTSHSPFDMAEGSQAIPNPANSSSSAASTHDLSVSVDVESMKRKAEEIASSLHKFRSNTKHASVAMLLQDYEPPEELKRYRERSLYVAQKLKEDRLLFEESKKRNEAVVDKVRTVKRIHKNISDNTKELKREDNANDDSFSLRIKIERLEASVSHLQNSLVAKNRALSEKNEAIRTLNESIANTHSAHMSSLEQSQEEIQRLKEEHAMAIEKVINSRDEFCNQLQVIRKKYLQVENDLKLSDFARCRLVSRNAQLREKIVQLENEKSELKAMIIPNEESSREEDERKSKVLPASGAIAVDAVRPKVESIAMITNEFYSFLTDDVSSDIETASIVDDDCDLLRSIDKVGEKLESAFYIVRDKMYAFSQSQDLVKQTNEKLSKLEALNEDSKNQEVKLKKILATMKAKVQSEISVNKELTEQLSKARENIKFLEEASNRDLSSRDQELEIVNEQLRYELNDLRNKLTSVELAAGSVDEIQKLKDALDAKTRECDRLRQTCEQLEDSNDKLENDFVVLQKRDCDDEDSWKRRCAQLRGENDKLLESVRSMSEKAIEYENERLSWYARAEDSERLQHQLEAASQHAFELQTVHADREAEMQREVDDLKREVTTLTRQLKEAREQLADEIKSGGYLKERVQFAEDLNANLSNEIHDLQERNRLLEVEKGNIERMVTELERKIDTLDTENGELKEYCEQSKTRMKDYERELLVRDDQWESLKNINENQACDLDQLRRQIHSLQMENTRQAELCEQYKSKRASEELDVEAMKRVNDELTFSTRELRQQVSALQEENSALIDRCEQLRSQLVLIERENSQLIVNLQERELPSKASGCQDSRLDEQTISELRRQLAGLEDENRQLLTNYERRQLEIVENEQRWLERVDELERRLELLEDEKRELASMCERYEAASQPLETIGGFQQRIDALEAEKRKLNEDCEKFKTKYQRLQLYCKANINKTSSDGGVNTETELWKRKYNELKAIATSSEGEVTRLQELVAQLEAADAEERERSNEYEETLRRSEADLEMARMNLQQVYSQLEERRASADTEELEHTRAELRKSEENLELAYSKLQEMQTSIELVVAECVRQVDDLRSNITDLKNENDTLRRRCESYRSRYVELYNHVDAVVGRGRVTSEEALRIFYKLQNEWQVDNIETAHAEVVCDEETSRMRTTLNELHRELSALREQYHIVEDQLQQKSEAARAEIAKYESSLSEMRSVSSLLEDRLANAELLLRQKDDDFHQYRCSMDAFVESETEKYEQYIAELRQSKFATVDTAVQVDAGIAADVDLPKQQPATLIKYFDYYKGKITKEISGILQPDEQADDYSNWILPEKQDIEYQNMYQQVPQFESHDPLGENSRTIDFQRPELLADSSMQSPHVLHQSSQTTVLDQDRTTQTASLRQLSMSDVLDRLRALILDKYDESSWPADEVDAWSNQELNVEDINFVSTAFKFVDLFDLVVKYYSKLPATEVVLSKFREIGGEISASVEVKADRDMLEHLVSLTTRLECENKYLLDAVLFVEDLTVARQSTPTMRFHSVIQGWRRGVEPQETDVIDRVCEEYDIVPAKFAAGELLTTWKENIAAKLVELRSPLPADSAAVLSRIESILKALQNKTLKLISDVRYDKNFNPFDFVDQIEGINQFVEHTVNVVRGEEHKLPEPESISHSRDEDHHHEQEHDHDHEQEHDHDHDYEHAHRHGHEHDHIHGHEQHAVVDNRDDDGVVNELKSMLAESNKKIDSLVRELMEIKNSREYNEVQQLHAKLDETLYQLHLRDVHVVELTRELTQLLSERDSLQLRLSNIIRQNEQLREASIMSNAFDDSGAPPSDLSTKLEELNRVNYMKDPRISEASRQYHATEMQLFNEEQSEATQRSKVESGFGFGVPSLLHWLTGESEGK